MAIGSHCLFTATGALTNPFSTYPIFEDFNPIWMETRDPDNVYSLASGNIRVAEAGRYLVTIGLAFVGIEAKLAIHTRCRRNTTVIEKSYAVGNARNGANPNILIKSEFMVELAANDIIDIQWAEKLSTSGAINPAFTYIQLVRLTDGVDTAYALYSDGTDATGYDSATAAPTPFDTIDEETDTDVIQRHATNDDEFLLKGSIGDRFLVLASVYFEGAVDRYMRELNATLDGVQINGVGSQFYTSDSNISDGSLNVSFIVTKKLNSDETLRITVLNPLGPVTTLIRTVNQSGLHIMKLLPITEIAMFHDATGGEAIEGVTQILNVWNNVDDIDAASFVRGNAQTLAIQKTGTYICGANIHGSRGSSTTRSNYFGRFTINGANVIEGNHGCYSRILPRTGHNMLGILAINNLQTLGVRTTDIGQNGDDTGTLPNRVGAWAINADTLEPVQLIKAINETVNILESSFAINSLINVLDESVEIQESINKLRNLTRLINEVENIAENSINVSVLINVLDESVEIQESINKLRNLTRLINEVENIAENSIILQRLLRMVNEIIDLSENVQDYANLSRIINEALNIDELPLFLVSLLIIINESLELSENVISDKLSIKIIDESVSIQETVNKTLDKIILANESVNISEDVINELEISIVINEVENISESEISAFDFVKIIDEFVNIEEDLSITSSIALVRIVQETIEIIENSQFYQFFLTFFLTFKSRILKN